MDNLLEILVPLIFAAIYFFGNMFSGKSDEDGDSPPAMPRRRGSDGEDADAAERQRRIQEEIRRKIMERRRASEGEPARPQVPVGQEIRDPQAEVAARREAAEKEAAQRAAREKAQKEPSAYSIPSHEFDSTSEDPVFSWDESDNAYENSMQARLRRIEATKQKAEKLRKQAAESGDVSSPASRRNRKNTGGYFTGTVRESLQDPQAARVAFIYGEVIGQPISLRKDASSVPGLS